VNKTVIDTCVNAVDIGLQNVHLVLDVTRASGMKVGDTHVFFTPPAKVLNRAQDKHIKLVRSETLINNAI